MVATRASKRAPVEEVEEKVASPIDHKEEEDTAQVTEESSASSASSALESIASEDTSAKNPASSCSQGHSRLFSPYRTLGIVSSGCGYHVQTHTSSDNALVTIPIGERFHVLQCDKLQPVLVSQAVPNEITHLISDSALQLTLVAHGQTLLTLYQRTRPIQTLSTTTSQRDWNIVNMLHLGKTKVPMKGEKEGKRENAVICAVVLAKHDENKEEDDDTVPVEGDDSSDEEDEGDCSSDEDDSAVQCCGQVVVVLATRTSLYIQKRISLTTVSSFQPTVAMHPSTYLNKIVLGAKDGSMLLLNVRTAKIIYVFTCLPQNGGSITALEQSPAVDTIAVGTFNGKVHLVNLKHDKKLFSLDHNGSSITSLSFRTDGSALRYGIAPLAVGRSDGTISIWDLTTDEEAGTRTLLCEMKKVHHPGGVCQLSYFPQEPLLLSIGNASNAVLMHIFDSPDHSGRLLKQRRGHVSPPQHVRYMQSSNGILPNSADGTDAASCQILSGGGLDRTLRVFSTARSVLDKEYSQGPGLEKRAKQLGLDSTSDLLLPPITATAVCAARSRDWGDLVTIHRNHAMAYVWSTKRGAQSGPVLRQSDWNVSAMQVPPPKSAHATSVTLSSCGNYCVVGTRGGTIYKYNVQSGLARGSYPKDATTDSSKRGGQRSMPGSINRTMKALEKKMKVSNRPTDMDKEERDAVQAAKMEQRRLAQLARGSHVDAAVTGLAVDSVNKTLISVGADSKLILWNFATHAPHKRSPHMLPSPATKLCHVRDSDLAAIAMEDFSVALFDCATLSVVRRFGVGTVRHTAPISDLGFSPDGRSLFMSSLDGTVRVWDVPTNTCVDWLGFHTPPTSLTISPTGEFLATTHVNKVGISLWSDRTFYQTVHMNGAHPPSEPAKMDDPGPIAETGEKADDRNDRALPITFAAKQDANEEEDSKLPPVAKEDGLITLSGMPPAHWKNLFHLELVKERNKPKEAPKKPPSAPFFLQWRGGETFGGQPASETTTKPVSDEKAEEEEWDAVWSDDDDGTNVDMPDKKRSVDVTEGNDGKSSAVGAEVKRRKISHYRSHLAALLEECFQRPASRDSSRFQAVTDHVATLGPSAIDVSLSTLCSGIHDLEEGLPLLHKCALWLLEACQSRQRYEAVNAYLHRFLYIHANVLAGIDTSTNEEEEGIDQQDNNRAHLRTIRRELLETVSLLKEAQQWASDALRGKMQHTLCLLRHFSRMV